MAGLDNISMPADASSDPCFQRPKKRPRAVVACLRCKTRRQKCDNKLPACSNCARAKLNCVFPENEYPSSYVKALETRVAWLEAQLDPSRQSRSEGHFSGGDGNEAAASSEGRITSPTGTPNLASSVGLLSLHAAAEPQYFGVSSGVSLALMIETAVYEKARPISCLSLPSETVESPFSGSSQRGSTAAASSPPLEKAASFVTAYLSYIHPNFPFLSKHQLWKAHHNRQEVDDSTTSEGRHDHVVLQLVYAIGSRCLKLVGSEHIAESEPESFYHSAMAKLQDQLNVPSVQNIQLILLVAIYALRSPSGSSVWHLCGLMIRQCVELGLHRQLQKDENTAHSDEFKRRLFWSIYHLERRIVLVLGRPLAIADDEIDIPLPHEIEDDRFEDIIELAETSREHQVSNQHSGPGVPSTVAGTDILFHVHNVLLDQLNAKSRLTLARLAKTSRGTQVERKIAKRFQELEDWKTAIFGHSTGGDASTDLMLSTLRTPVQTPVSRPALPEAQRLALLLNYHRARRMLLQTILTEIQLPNQAFPFSSFAKSSGEVCQLNRRLHRVRSVPFTLLDLHSVFVAGFSMIYCAWSHPSLYDAEMAADLGACSTVLYLITEQWGAGAKKYRDAFELIAGKTAEYVLSPRRSQVNSQQRPPSVGLQAPLRASAAASDTVPGPEMPHPATAYDDMERPSSDNWTKDSLDVWQMMTEFVQTQDSDFECDPVNFREIEEFLTEEGLGWFNGGTGMGF
ncbi:uncharacterized protein A1O5_03217 [Cladophialophora psammophila CBS 110553]|uniref:Zn(2)-C6 fungal-type domain-containing protein n=1 Tax=Cladophialophora psammophila CBS 110553 TaxID=1182543 RepID=W9X956_9EURO|nr:uncharacterized protein A1O5_03217 [Cladophialophora psammophila CBS 110553]EXJ73456.1 hypothetical protein A1O5_03217 [Cladophialophora psammophila CBS 110553]